MINMEIRKDCAKAREEDVRQWMRGVWTKYPTYEALADGACEHFGWTGAGKRGEEIGDLTAFAKEVFGGHEPATQGTPAGGVTAAQLLNERTNSGKPSEVQDKIKAQGRGWEKVAKADEAEVPDPPLRLASRVWRNIRGGIVRNQEVTAADVSAGLDEDDAVTMDLWDTYYGRVDAALPENDDSERKAHEAIAQMINQQWNRIQQSPDTNDEGEDQDLEDTARATLRKAGWRKRPGAEDVEQNRHDPRFLRGTTEGHYWEAVVYEEPSARYGIEGGTISKLWIREKGAGSPDIFSYDRGLAENSQLQMDDPLVMAVRRKLEGVGNEAPNDQAYIASAGTAGLRKAVSRRIAFNLAGGMPVKVAITDALRKNADSIPAGQEQWWATMGLGLAESHIAKIAHRRDVTPADKARAGAEAHSFADPKNKKYKLDTAGQVRSAMSYIQVAKNRDKYSPKDAAAIEARIRSAGKKFGIEWEKTVKPNLRKAGADAPGLDADQQERLDDWLSKNIAEYMDTTGGDEDAIALAAAMDLDFDTEDMDVMRAVHSDVANAIAAESERSEGKAARARLRKAGATRRTARPDDDDPSHGDDPEPGQDDDPAHGEGVSDEEIRDWMLDQAADAIDTFYDDAVADLGLDDSDGARVEKIAANTKKEILSLMKTGMYGSSFQAAAGDELGKAAKPRTRAAALRASLRKDRLGTCQCSDPGCPVHNGKSSCTKSAKVKMYRTDMEDESGTAMCTSCADDAMDSGSFVTGRERQHNRSADYERAAPAALRKDSRRAVEGRLFGEPPAVDADAVAAAVEKRLAPALQAAQAAAAQADDISKRLEFIERQPQGGGPVLRPQQSPTAASQINEQLSQLQEEVMNIGRKAATEANPLIKRGYLDDEIKARGRLEAAKRKLGMA